MLDNFNFTKVQLELVDKSIVLPATAFQFH